MTSLLDKLLKQTETNTEALDALDKSGGKSGSGRDPNHPLEWKPPVGTVGGRVLPSLDGKYITELHVHWKVWSKPFLCPKKNFGEPCAVCDFGWELFNEFKESNDVKIKEKAKLFLPNNKYYTKLIVRELEEEDIEQHGRPLARIFEFNWNTLKELRRLSNDEDYKNYEHIVEGRDFKITYDKVAADNREQATTIAPRPKSTKVFNWEDKKSPYSKIIDSDEKMAEMVYKVLEDSPSFFDKFERVTSSQTMEILAKYKEAPSANSSDVEKYGSETKSEENKEVTSKTETVKNDIQSKIEDFFNNDDDELM